ncbi:hypothetical protein UPYG_G00194360 [Umbra pygmaea]|uniref:T-cell surface glycoprotein CD3 epsilon chain n=1 Tax=Umbra pygmaea TaxID=75934 RepID=A0ABD0WLM3_UMBPY
MSKVSINVRLVFLIMTVTAVEGKGDVTFWRDKVTLTCPEKGDWYKDGNMLMSDENELEINMNELSSKVMWDCKYESGSGIINYQFYIKGRGCKNCFEVETALVAGAIVGDLLLTAAVILIVYRWAHKKSGPAAPKKLTTRSRGPAPVVPDSDYEPLRLGSRGTNIYATASEETTE